MLAILDVALSPFKKADADGLLEVANEENAGNTTDGVDEKMDVAVAEDVDICCRWLW